MIALRRNIVSDRAAWWGDRRPAFTLVELLVSLAILTLLASILLVGLAGVTEKAREERTRTFVERISTVMTDQWNSYRTRRAPVALPPAPPNATTPQARANYQKQRMQLRLLAMRELMSLELPNTKAEVYQTPMFLTNVPGMTLAYRRMVARLTSQAAEDPTKITDAMAYGRWSSTHESAECLYLILSRINDGDSPALSLFQATEYGDTDADGIPEMLDGWGQPLLFMRWAPGFSAHPGPDQQWGNDGVDDDQDGITDNASEALWKAPGALVTLTDDIPSPSSLHDRRATRDEFDPFQVAPTADSSDPNPLYARTPFPLFPLIVSAGGDRTFGLKINSSGDGPLPNRPNRPYLDPMLNPYVVDSTDPLHQWGAPDPSSSAYTDNIHNHTL